MSWLKKVSSVFSKRRVVMLLLFATLATLVGLQMRASFSERFFAHRGADRVLRELRAGEVIWLAPKSISLGEVETVQVILSRELSQGALQRLLPGRHEGQTEGAATKVAEQMEATLSSPDFEVKPITPPIQLVGSKGVTRWLWTIKPLALGSSALTLNLNARLKMENEPMLQSVETFSKKISVNIWSTKAVLAASEMYKAQIAAVFSAIGVAVTFLLGRKWGWSRRISAFFRAR